MSTAIQVGREIKDPTIRKEMKQSAHRLLRRLSKEELRTCDSDLVLGVHRPVYRGDRDTIGKRSTIRAT